MSRLSEPDRRALQSLIDHQQTAVILPYLVRREGNEWRAFCPYHQDPTTSKTTHASINFLENKWNCFGPECGAKGKVTLLLRDLERRAASGSEPSDDNNVVDIKTGEPVEQAADLPSDKNIRNYHGVLMGMSAGLRYLHDQRGLTDETIERHRIGYNNGMPRPRTYVLPVYARDGKTLVAVRLYRKNAKAGTPKMTYWGRPGRTFLVNVKALDRSDDVVITGGEWDCYLLEQELGDDVAVVTHTAGEGSWREEWSREFKDKNVFLCYDEDAAGEKGMLKVARSLEGIVANVYLIRLGTGIKSGDVTDFFVKCGNDADDFRALMDKARQEPFRTSNEPDEPPAEGKPVTLKQSNDAGHRRDAMELYVSVSGNVRPPFLVPRSIEASCSQDAGKVCVSCPMKRFDGKRTLELPPHDERIIKFINTSEAEGPNSTRGRLMRSISGAHCDNKIKYAVEREWNVEELQVSQSIDHRRADEDDQAETRHVYSVGTFATPLNRDARMIAKQVPSPSNSRAFLQTWSVEQLAADMDKFEVTPELLDELAIFQCDKDQEPLFKMREIADDLAANVTHIYGRPGLHIAYDIVWHSVLGFKLLGREEPKGYLEMLALGDTRTGKSEVVSRMASHYQAGVVQSCEGATFAGLVGGVEQMGSSGRWSVHWGVIPLNDRRLVALDEMSGLRERDVIENMSSIRSSGVAELVKIASERTSARTRLIWISNPVGTSTIARMPGYRAIGTLIKQPEDIARFDFVMAVREDEVSSSVINTLERPEVPHVYTSDLCSKLVMWAWSRSSDQVRWYKDSDKALVRLAEQAGKRYVPEPPLVQAANIRIKLARIAVAIAARTFSASADGQTIIVRPEHVQAASDFLDAIYGSDAMGYLAHSERRMRDRVEARENRVQARKMLRKDRGLLNVLLAVEGQKFKWQDFDGASDEFPDGKDVLRWFRDRKLVRRLDGNLHEIEPALTEVLREIEDE